MVTPRISGRRGDRSAYASGERRGNAMVLTAVLLVVVLGMTAFAIDVGDMLKVQTDLDRAVDAAVLAGAGLLVDGQQSAEDQIFEYLALNPVGPDVHLDEAALAEWKAWYQARRDQPFLDDRGQPVLDANGNPMKLLDLTVGRWDPNGGDDGQGAVSAYEADGSAVDRPSSIGLSVVHDNHPFFFAKIFGKKNFAVKSEAVAIYQPRDIVIVLDYSASMNDDSELKSISSLGSTTVINNLQQIYEDLGSPVYGSMQFDPVYISSSNDSYVMQQLGLTNVPYPYPSGSWGDFINYVQASNNQPAHAGYRKKFGYLTLINYWLDTKPAASQTPDLWRTREQPIHALKQATEYFVDYVAAADTDDRIGLAVYNGPDGEGVLEQELTVDFDAVKNISNQRQAGHYHSYTNIAAGMTEARLELLTTEEGGHGRNNAFRMIVLMTDGNANWNNGQYNESAANQAVLDEAELCRQLRIPIMAISLGAEADTDIMQQVADITGGLHFNIPGGQTGDQYEEALIEVFRQIADKRPLRLVH